MTRSKLAAATAVLTLSLAACATEGSDDTTSSTEATEDAGTTASGDLTGTITDAQETEDGAIALTVETDEGTQELSTSGAAYITAPNEAGGQQRTRLTTWLQNNELDGSTEYSLRVRDGVVTDIEG
jgi:hypothetical protein